MKKSETLNKVLEKVEIALAIALFFVMLVTCGMYIDIRINGQSTSLPPIPAGLKEVLLKTASSDSAVYSDDLLEPVFIGFKDDEKHICATFDAEVRQSLENAASSYLLSLFSGKSESIEFENDDAYFKFMKQIKNSERYVLVSYFSDIPASVFLPCLSNDVQTNNSGMDFFVKHVFILSDENKNVYGLAFSSDKKVYKLIPRTDLPFDKITAYEYDVNDGFSYFTFPSEYSLNAVFETSFVSNKYNIATLYDMYGFSLGTDWIDRCFGVFNISESLVKSYSFNDDTEIVYVDDVNELLVSNDGTVEFSSGTEGVYLRSILDYEVPVSGNYLFSDKISAIKKIVNSVKPANDLTDCGIVGVDYDSRNMQLSVYLKYFVNGISVTENNYDAVFRIVGNSLVYAKFQTFLCTASDEVYVYVNQKYMNQLFEDEQITDNSDVFYFTVFEKEEDGKLYVPKNAVVMNEGGER